MKHIAAQYFLNSDLRKDELEKQAELLSEAGYGEIYLHARAGMETPYLSKSFFDALAAVIAVLKKHQVKFSIWDEDNFPSGVVGNRIINDYPELAAARLNFLSFEAKAGVPSKEFFSAHASLLKCFTVSGDGRITDISKYCGTLKESWGKAYVHPGAYSPGGQVPLPHRRREMNASRMSVLYTPEEDCRIVAVEIVRATSIHNTDLLNRATVDKLVEYTHEEYKNHLGEETLRNDCLSSFLDEPAPEGNFPWTRTFAEEFRADHNYDLIPLLPHLAADLNAESAAIRNDYRSTLHRLLCENYLGYLKTYLNADGIKSVGHLSRSEYISFANTRWPDQLRCLQYFDIPCGDPLGGAIGKMGCTANHIGLKTIAAAARFAGKPAGADAFAVGGDNVSLRDLKFMADYHLTMGINYFNVHGLDYTIEGERFDETPPTLFYQHAQWRHMKEFVSYLKERCETLSAPHVCKIGFLYPDIMMKSLAPGSPLPDEVFHETAEELLSHQQDFELIDSMTLAEQTPKEYAALRPYFIVAHNTRIIRSTAEFLKRYTGCGGKLIVTGTLPQIIDLPGAPSWEFGRKFLTDDLLSGLPSPSVAGKGSEAVLIHSFETADGAIDTFIFNRSDLPFDGTFEGKRLFLEAGESKLASELDKIPAQRLTLPENWSLRFDAPNSVPLTFWSYRGGIVELFSRARQEKLPFDEATEFHSTFLAAEGFKVFLTIEEKMLRDGEFSVNGIPVKDFVKAEFRDCRDLECDITGLLKTGRSPMLNKITYTGSPLFGNPPYLRGVFSAFVPPGTENIPVLRQVSKEHSFRDRADFRNFGYGTYSGAALCSAEAEVPQKGRCLIQFSQVNDSARLFIDGKDQGIRIAPPYCWEIELEQGKHAFEVEVCNNSGNRDRNLGQAAGIQI